MDFVNKYLMPHKKAILLLLALDIFIYGVHTALEPLIQAMIFAVLVWIGFDSQRRLGFDWIKSIKTAALLGVLVGAINIAIITPSLKSLTIPMSLVELGFGIVMGIAFAIAFQTIVNVVFVSIGYLIAKYLVPKASVGKSTEPKKQTKH